MSILSIGEKIKKERKKLGMTLKDLAGSRVTTSQISLIESGKANPSMDLLEYLANSLNVSIEYLLESEHKQAIKICEYYENLAFCYLFQKNIKEVHRCLDNMEPIIEKYNLENLKYKRYFIIGICNYEIKDYDKAIENILLSNFGFLKLSMYNELINSYIYLSYICIDQDDHIGAIVNLKCAIKIIDNYLCNYDLLFFKVYYLISKSYLKIGNVDESEFYLNRSMDVLDKIYKPRESVNMFIKKSIDYMYLEDIDNAIKFSRLSRKYFEDINNLYEQQVVQVGISNELINKNKLSNVNVYLNRAKNINLDYNFENLFEIYKSFILLYIKKNNLNKAKYYLGKYQCALNTNNVEKTLDFYILKYKVHILEKSYGDAEIALILAYNFAKENEKYERAGDFCLVLAKLYVDIRRDIEANNIMKEALKQYKKSGHKFNI